MASIFDSIKGTLTGLLPKPAAAATPTGPTASTASPYMDVINQLLGMKSGVGTNAGPSMSFSPQILEKLFSGGEDQVDVVGQHNARSNLPSSNPNSTGPWSGKTPLFKPMKEAFADTGARTGPEAIAPWARRGNMADRGETIQRPNVFGSSFVPGSSDLINKDGMATGRAINTGRGYGSSTFAAPMVPAGQRLFNDDQALQISNLLQQQAPGTQAKPQTPNQQRLAPLARTLYPGSMTA